MSLTPTILYCEKPKGKKNQFKFKCPKCKHNQIEEVVTDAIKYSIIKNISLAGVTEYGKVHCEEGFLSYYQCAKCGNTIPASSPEDLAEWLKENGVKK